MQVYPAKGNCFSTHYLYRYRHLEEHRFLDFKRWRDIATRYANKPASFAAAIEIRIIAMWLNIL
jgi:transposase